ncbi:Cytochrome c-551 [Gammaproteobacteria bacterium]
MNLINKIAVVGVVGLIATGISISAMAAEGEALLAGKDCVACHKQDMKIVGPSYKDIATKYKGVDGAKEKLVAKVKSGGAGNWGPIPMPPHPTISDDDLNKIIAWIISLS